MTSDLPIIYFIVCVVCGTVFSFPCLTNKSKHDFNKARNALKSIENYLKNQASSINSKLQALDKDMTLMEEDFKRRQLIKFNKHCYYIGDDSVIWTDAERKWREIGRHLVKVGDSSENSLVQQQISKSSKKTHFWLGSTDAINDDWRLVYDQTQISYTKFPSGRPYPTSNSNSYSVLRCTTAMVIGTNFHVIPNIPIPVKVISVSNSDIDDYANSSR